MEYILNVWHWIGQATMLASSLEALAQYCSENKVEYSRVYVTSFNVKFKAPVTHLKWTDAKFNFLWKVNGRMCPECSLNVPSECSQNVP
jgi:hypothetical protein